MTDGHCCSLDNGLRLKITARACMKYGRPVQVTAFFAAFELFFHLHLLPACADANLFIGANRREQARTGPDSPSNRCRQAHTRCGVPFLIISDLCAVTDAGVAERLPHVIDKAEPIARRAFVTRQ